MPAKVLAAPYPQQHRRGRRGTFTRCPWRHRRKEQAAITLDELNARFLPLPEAERDGRALRGMIWAVAMAAFEQLPEGPGKALVIERLAEAADLATDLMAPAATG